ncbi:hypothetical protein BGX26_005657 [Mortierella sp. AD094]|nr:hypothetical protein BGX26_005657 [Mortierella sp. AD094]
MKEEISSNYTACSPQRPYIPIAGSPTSQPYGNGNGNSNSIRYLFEPYLEGKVHGSLARAGKVKSQTPKVAKQEKKKKLTGRAKKRDTYKRRFVNVTNAPGGKRRMNVNPESSKN